MPRKKVEQPQVPVLLPIDSCRPSQDNPNVEDLVTFNELVEEIKHQGFNENIVVVANPDGETHAIVAGEHRWRAAKPAGLTHVTAVVKGWDEDRRKIEMVRMNLLRGRLDPKKFTEPWTGLEEKYGRTALMRLMGLQAEEKELERLLQQTKRTMPDDMAEEPAKRAAQIRNVEDLATVVQSLYAQYGSTLDRGYMFFSYGGRTHLMLHMTRDMRDKLRGRLTAMAEKGRDANALIMRGLEMATEAPVAG